MEYGLIADREYYSNALQISTVGQSRSQLHTVYHYPLVVIETNADNVKSALNVEYNKFVLGCACAGVVFQCASVFF